MSEIHPTVLLKMVQRLGKDVKIRDPFWLLPFILFKGRLGLIWVGLN